MIINSRQKQIPKGFLLQKDYFNSQLLLSRKFKDKERPVFLRSIEQTPTNLRLKISQAPYLSTKTRNVKSLSPIKPIKIKRPFPKAYLPNCSSLDFHASYHTKEVYALRPMEDDLNITSLNSKKLLYAKREDIVKETKSTHTNTFYVTSRYDPFTLANYPVVDYFRVSRETFKKRMRSSNTFFKRKRDLVK